MRVDDLRERLSTLASEATNVVSLADFAGWKSRSLAVLRAVVGPDAPQVREFELAAQLINEGYTISGGNVEEYWAGDAMRRGAQILEAAAYALELMEDEAQLDGLALDPGLWTHVQGLVTSEDWGKIPATVAVYVEDAVRRWGGDPRNKSGGAFVGKDLYTKLMGSEGELRLGKQASEWEGWRNLATGMAQAIGNVDRHRIQRRPDAKRYAMGVLGLGSLLLTQLRREHQDTIAEIEALEAEHES